VVQRLLGRFTAQGFVFHDLSRACLAQTTDSIPRVLLIGRLALYGPGAARLHEELIPITARWSDPMIRKGSLVPYGREAETKTLALLDQSLIRPESRVVPDVVKTQLKEDAARDVQELLPHLESRAAEYATDAIALLAKRADAEAKAMREILEIQQKHIGSTITKYDETDQLRLGFDNEEERRQLESNRRYWGKRLTELENELDTEPERIRSQYEVKARRIQPVGLVYLWPIAG
jgi:hypothetical protein